MRDWTRRGAIGAAAAAAACAPARLDAPPAAPTPSLASLAAAKGLRFGSAIGAGGALNEFADAEYRRVMAQECGLAVSENEHKWPYLQPEPGRFEFARADALMAWADEAGLAYRGHTLVWNKLNWLPRWVMEHDFGANPRAEGERLVGAHIRSVCAHFGGRIGSWDVVNETVDENTGELRQTPLSASVGPELVAFCFHTAREAAPHAQLVYNDYMGPGATTHCEGVLRHLEAWLKAGAPIDALGVQSHLGGAPIGAEQERAWRGFLDEVTGMGLGLLITEFDVNDRALAADVAERDAEVAARARGYLDLMLSYPQLKDVLAWGIVDKYSWLQTFTPREDGLALRCTPYDSAFRAKPMREAIAAAFASAPAR